MNNIIVYGATPNIYTDLRTSLTSLLVNNASSEVYILSEEDTLPFCIPDNCHIINVKNQQFFKEDCPNYNTNGRTYMTLMRCVLSELLPQNINSALWIDTDTVIIGGLSELFETSFDDNYVMGVKHIQTSNYINAGVTYFNLAKIKKDNKTIEMIDYLNSKRLFTFDETCINDIFKDKIKFIDHKYNVCKPTGLEKPDEDVKIYHFPYNERPLKAIWHRQKYRDESEKFLPRLEVGNVNK